MNADLIYIVGGKKHIYSKLFNETNTVDLIKQIAERKVLMGTSAGSIVLGKQIQSKSFWKERYDIDYVIHKEILFILLQLLNIYIRTRRNICLMLQ